MSGFPKEKFFSPGRSGDEFGNGLDAIQWDYAGKLVRTVMKRAVKHYLRFSSESAVSLPEAEKDKTYLLYLHVPFCSTLCPYCSFHRFKFHEETARRYFRYLRDEMRMTAALGYNFNSAYFGGGTTSILPDELAETIDLAKELFDIKEVSSETDPNHIDDYCLGFTAGRIDRLSVGVQSFSDRHLENIGRRTKFGSGQQQYDKISQILKIFPIVNIDLIYNFPSQTKEDLAADIRTVRELQPQQATFYPLMYAPIAGKKLAETLGRSDYETEAEFFRLISEMMTEPYVQRSSWAYALKQKGFIDEYVVDHSEYVGLGSGAFSFIKDTLYSNSFSLQEYGDRISNGCCSAVKSVKFSNHSIDQYRMMVEMFGMNGNPSHKPFVEYNILKAMGAVSGSGENAAMTRRGLFLLSVMMKCFYNGMDYIREIMRHDLAPSDERIV